jgi:tetratricopeptide (TPR) repeat protein
MRMSWRMYLMMVLFGAWPHLGCHQLPGDKSVQDLRPLQQTAGETPKKQELTAADITQSWLAKADKLEKDGKTNEAIALCEKMREPGNPQAIPATKRIALLYDRRHDLDRAEQEYRLLLQQNPKDADVLAKLGDVYYRRGKWGAAEKLFSDAVHHRPDHVVAWSGLGMTLAQLGDYDKSFEAFSKVLPRAEAYCEVAFVLKLQGKPHDAVRAYEEALKADPAMPRASTELAKIRQVLLTDPAPMPTPFQMGQRGVVQMEEAPVRMTEETGRQMMQRPVLPALPDWDLPGDGKK